MEKNHSTYSGEFQPASVLATPIRQTLQQAAFRQPRDENRAPSDFSFARRSLATDIIPTAAFRSSQSLYNLRTESGQTRASVSVMQTPQRTPRSPRVLQEVGLNTVDQAVQKHVIARARRQEALKTIKGKDVSSVREKEPYLVPEHTETSVREALVPINASRQGVPSRFSETIRKTEHYQSETPIQTPQGKRNVFLNAAMAAGLNSEPWLSQTALKETRVEIKSRMPWRDPSDSVLSSPESASPVSPKEQASPLNSYVGSVLYEASKNQGGTMTMGNSGTQRLLSPGRLVIDSNGESMSEMLVKDVNQSKLNHSSESESVRESPQRLIHQHAAREIFQTPQKTEPVGSQENTLDVQNGLKATMRPEPLEAKASDFSSLIGPISVRCDTLQHATLQQSSPIKQLASPIPPVSHMPVPGRTLGQPPSLTHLEVGPGSSSAAHGSVAPALIVPNLLMMASAEPEPSESKDERVIVSPQKKHGSLLVEKLMALASPQQPASSMTFQQALANSSSQKPTLAANAGVSSPADLVQLANTPALCTVEVKTELSVPDFTAKEANTPAKDFDHSNEFLAFIADVQRISPPSCNKYTWIECKTTLQSIQKSLRNPGLMKELLSDGTRVSELYGGLSTMLKHIRPSIVQLVCEIVHEFAQNPLVEETLSQLQLRACYNLILDDLIKVSTAVSTQGSRARLSAETLSFCLLSFSEEIYFANIVQKNKLPSMVQIWNDIRAECHDSAVRHALDRSVELVNVLLGSQPEQMGKLESTAAAGLGGTDAAPTQASEIPASSILELTEITCVPQAQAVPIEMPHSSQCSSSQVNESAHENSPTQLRKTSHTAAGASQLQQCEPDSKSGTNETNTLPDTILKVVPEVSVLLSCNQANADEIQIQVPKKVDSDTVNEIVALKEKNLHLQVMLEEYCATLNQLIGRDSYMQEYERKQADCNALQADLNKLKADMLTNTESYIALKARYDIMKRKAEYAETAARQTAAQNTTLKSTVDELRTWVENHRKESAQTIEQSKEEHLRAVSECERKMAEMQQQLEDAQSERSRLGIDKKIQESLLANVQSQLASKEKLISMLNDQNRKLEQRVFEYESKVGSIEQLEIMRKEYITLKSQAQSFASLDAENKNLKVMAFDKNEQITSLQRQLAETREALAAKDEELREVNDIASALIQQKRKDFGPDS